MASGISETTFIDELPEGVRETMKFCKGMIDLAALSQWAKNYTDRFKDDPPDDPAFYIARMIKLIASDMNEKFMDPVLNYLETESRSGSEKIPVELVELINRLEAEFNAMFGAKYNA